MHPLDWLLRVILPVTGVGVVSALLLVAWTTERNSLQVGFAPQQPVAFSHKQHAGDNKIPCQYCHTGAADSRYAGIPSVESCMNCHRTTKPGSDPIRAVTRYYEEGEALKWKRVHRLPDHVYFDHRPHVNAGINCAVCHGAVEKMERLEQAMSLRMGNCLQCHRNVHEYISDAKYRYGLDPKLSGPDHCYACHR